MLDLSVLLSLNHLAASSPALGAIAVVGAQWGPEIMALVMAVVFLASRRSNERMRRGVIYGAGSAILALVISGVIGHFVFRERPEYADPRLVTALIQHPNDSSFPSDHASVAFALAIALFYAGDVAWPFLVAAVVVALSRVATGVHWPTDVIAGAVVGTLSAVFILRTRQWYEKPIVVPILRLFGGERHRLPETGR